MKPAFHGCSRPIVPELSGPDLNAKPVALSHLWSYTGITECIPFFGEANVNVDVPASQLPITICHEISHTRGIAREQDANLAGFLACLNSSRIDFHTVPINMRICIAAMICINRIRMRISSIRTNTGRNLA
jgi:hypothetical protein